MTYNRYAMPVDPRVLKKDFESSSEVDDLGALSRMIQRKLIPFKNANPIYLKIIHTKLHSLWKNIDSRIGINLRDREKLLPHFTLLGEAVPSKPVKVIYRGVRLSSYDPNLLSKTYPTIKKGEVISNPQDPKVLAHLESLAYGLRSWAEGKGTALGWAKGLKGNTIDPKRDKVVFVYPTPNIIFNASQYWKAIDKYHPDEMERWDNEDSAPFDFDEQIAFLQNPKIQEISFDKTQGVWFVVVSD